MGIFDFLFKSGTDSTRKAAQELGISVSMVERELPHFPGNIDSLKLVKGTTARYALPRQSSNISTWELLQRNQAHGANMPNFYLLNSSVSLSDELTEELRRVSEEYDEEYFEFEGTTSEVAVFWEEWGGKSKVESIHSLLEKLARL